MYFELIVVVLAVSTACRGSPIKRNNHIGEEEIEHFVEWSRTVVSYKFDHKTHIAQQEEARIRKNFNSISEDLGIYFNKVDNESFYLLITSIEQCVEQQIRADSYGSHAILVCIDHESDSSHELRRAVKVGFRLNEKLLRLKERLKL
jgi:hypothetical protein